MKLVTVFQRLNIDLLQRNGWRASLGTFHFISSCTEHRSQVVNTSVSCSGGPGFKYRPGDRLSWQRCFAVFLFLQANSGRNLKIRTRSLPVKSFPIYHSLITYSSLYNLSYWKILYFFIFFLPFSFYSAFLILFVVSLLLSLYPSLSTFRSPFFLFHFVSIHLLLT
jgi:hypothetical protein